MARAAAYGGAAGESPPSVSPPDPPVQFCQWQDASVERQQPVHGEAEPRDRVGQMDAERLNVVGTGAFGEPGVKAFGNAVDENGGHAPGILGMPVPRVEPEVWSVLKER